MHGGCPSSFHPLSWELTIFRFDEAASSAPSWWTWRVRESWTSYLIGRRKRRRPGCASAQISWRRDRDRGGEYASTAREVAPQATQYADGFHLLKNLREAFHSQIYKHTRRTRHVSYRRIF